MSPLLSCAATLQRYSRDLSEKEWEADSARFRGECLDVIKKVFEEAPPVEDVIFELVTLLLVLPVYDRIYLQRALRPLALKLDCVNYLTDLSRALQETDAWVDLNILTDKGRRSLPDMGLEITPEFKLP